MNKNNNIKALIESGVFGFSTTIGKKIYSIYKENSLNEIESSNHDIVKLIGPDFNNVWDSLHSKKKYLDLLIWLTNHKASAYICTKVCVWLKNESQFKSSEFLTLLKSDPYRLSIVPGVGFIKADQFAVNGCLIDVKSKERFYSIAREALRIGCENSGGGTLKSSVLNKIERLLQANDYINFKDATQLTNQVYQMAIESAIAIESKNENGVEFLFSNDFFYAEEAIAGFLLKKIKNQSILKINEDELNFKINEIEQESNLILTDDQKKAVKTILNNEFSLLIGKPGAGKTTTLKILSPIIESYYKNVIYAAPTGKAAKRMSTAINKEAGTIHRVLAVGLNDEKDFKSNGPQLLNSNYCEIKNADCIVIDEASMLDAKLLLRTLKSLNTKAKIVLIGDPNQLPSIGAGKVLQDLIDSEIITTVKLNKVLRQSEHSIINKVAESIGNGTPIDFYNKEDDCVFINTNPADSVANRISNIILKNASKKYNITKDIQVITSSKKGLSGSEHLNSVLQKLLNPKEKTKEEILISDSIIFREGDKVMQINNDYERIIIGNESNKVGVFNGDTGVILNISGPANNRTLTVKFDDGIALYSQKDAKLNLSLSWACTVHKFQGSESKVVFYAIDNSTPKPLRNRNMPYTAITRAKEKCIVIGNIDVFNESIKNNSLKERKTRLAGLLSGRLEFSTNTKADIVALSEERALELLLSGDNELINIKKQKKKL